VNVPSTLSTTRSPIRLNEGTTCPLGSVQAAGLPSKPAPSFVPGKYRTAKSPQSVAIGDLNGDGKPELATTNSEFLVNTLAVLVNTGGGDFQPRLDYRTGRSPGSVAIDDLNGDGEPDLATVDVGALTAAAVQARGWDGQVRLDAEDVVITSDPRRLEGIVANLVGNALEHGNGAAAVRVGREGDVAFVEVADEGPGIAPEHLPHLFERFYKADPARSSGGTGPGLAIAQENARLLGGRIEVWSEVGKGSRFTLRL
jgi:hypothetical protein